MSDAASLQWLKSSHQADGTSIGKIPVGDEETLDGLPSEGLLNILHGLRTCSTCRAHA